MVIRLDENYNAMTSTALLGYVGETNARPVTVEGMEIDGADRYVLTIDYGDGVQYEVDITGGIWTPTADILRSAQTVSCQICAKKLSGQEYILVKKSRIFRLRIGAAIGDNAVPSPSVAADALDRISAIGEQVEADVERAENAASTAMQAAENAKKFATAAEKSADTATQAASRAETAAQTAQSVADSLPEDYTTAVGKIAENTAEIANVKLTDKELQRRVDALFDMGQGVTHQFETDSETAYQKTVPTGAKLMSVKSIGGHSEVIDGEIVSAETESVVVGDTAHPIPEAIRNLPGYGWSAGTARNYVDYENKKYYQCVSSVDLGTLTWMKTSSQSVGDYFYAPVSAIGFKRLGAFGTTVHNILCSKYITVARNPNAFVDKTIVLDGDSIAVSQIQIKDTAYTDATTVEQAMRGVILYYELANPIITDISTLIDDDFLRNIEVEAGGSVTFKNSNGDNYKIPVPSEEEYIVKLSEVGGTT